MVTTTTLTYMHGDGGGDSVAVGEHAVPMISSRGSSGPLALSESLAIIGFCTASRLQERLAFRGTYFSVS